MRYIILTLTLLFSLSTYSQNEDIRLIGTVGTDGNQIKNVGDPTDAQDVVTKNYVDTQFYSQSQVNTIIANLQSQIDDLTSSVSDQDGNTYNYLTYGDQVWTVENAEMITYRDGTPIPQRTYGLGTEWESLSTGAWCYINNDPTKGRLYNWYAVMGKHDDDPNTPNKIFAPEGWHVPSDEEWTVLENYLINNGYNYDGTTEENKIAKAVASTTGWNDGWNTAGPGYDQSTNNSSGFNALPVGGLGNLGIEDPVGEIAIFYSSDLWHRYLGPNISSLNSGINPAWEGFSVRFVKD